MKRFAFLIIIVFLLVLIWSGAWFFAASLIKNQVASLNNPNNQITLSCKEFKVSGFPFKLNNICKSANIIDGDKQFQIAQINTIISAFSPTKININAISPFKYSNAFFASEQELRFSEFKITASTSWLKFNQLKISIKNLQYLDLLIGEEKIADVENFNFDLSNASNKKNTFDLNIKLDGLHVNLFNILDGQGILEAEINAMPDDIRLFADQKFFQNWQRANGQITLDEFKGQDKNSNFNIIGEIGLNERGFANGNFTIKSSGIIEQISQNIDPQMRPVFFGSQKEDGSFEQDIKIKNGTIYRGLFPLGNLPSLF